jgi:hypothetical protein
LVARLKIAAPFKSCPGHESATAAGASKRFGIRLIRLLRNSLPGKHSGQSDKTLPSNATILLHDDQYFNLIDAHQSGPIDNRYIWDWLQSGSLVGQHDE